MEAVATKTKTHFLTQIAEEFTGTMTERCEHLYQVHNGATKALLLMVGAKYITQDKFIADCALLQIELEKALDIAIELSVS